MAEQTKIEKVYTYTVANSKKQNINKNHESILCKVLQCTDFIKQLPKQKHTSDIKTIYEKTENKILCK